MNRISTAIAGVLVPSVASAHPDHLSDGTSGLLHLFTDPFHLGLAAAAIALFLGAMRSLRRARR